MQEEVTQRTVALCVEATKLSAGMLQQAMKKVLDALAERSSHRAGVGRKANIFLIVKRSSRFFALDLLYRILYNILYGNQCANKYERGV